MTHTGKAKLGARVRPGLVRADPRASRAARADAAGDPAPRRRAPRRHGPRGGGPGAGPLRARPRRRSRSSSRSRAVSRRGSRSCCSSSPAPRCCCSTSRPTTSTCSRPRRSRTGLEAFEGTVLAVTHDRWFARGFDRFLVFGGRRRVRVRRPGVGRDAGAADPLTRRTVGGWTRPSTCPSTTTSPHRQKTASTRSRRCTSDRPAWVTESDLDLRVGGRWHVRFHPRPTGRSGGAHGHRRAPWARARHDARIQDDAGHERFATQVLVTFESTGELTRVALHQSGFEDEATRDEFAANWPGVLEEIGRRVSDRP